MVPALASSVASAEGMYIIDNFIFFKSSSCYALQICIAFFESVQSVSCESVTVNKTTCKNAFTLIFST